MNVAMAEIGTSRPLSTLVFVLFLLNGLLANSTGSTTRPDGRLPPSSCSQQTPRPPLTLSAPLQSSITEVVSVSNEDAATKNNATALATTTNSSSTPFWKQQLPFPLNNKTKTLQRILIPGEGRHHESSLYRGSDVEVFLLGTAHVSKDSSRDVRQLLESVEPDAIFLELCHQRLNLLEDTAVDNDEVTVDNDEQLEEDKQDPANNMSNNAIWDQCRGLFRRERKTRKKRKNNEKRIDTRSFSSIASSLLSNMQGDFADSLEVELGGEFRAAYQYWNKVVPRGISSFRKEHRIHNVHLILGDRPVSLTLTRAWESLRIWGKIKLMVGLIVSSLRKPNPDELREWMERILYGDTDLMSESVTELAKHFPTLAEVILKERDAYMACKLHQTCRRLLFAGRRSRSNRRYRLVAIVGAGHVEGISRWLTNGGSLKTISTVVGFGTTDDSSTSIPTATKEDASSQQPMPETPEDILSKLIQIKATIAKEDHDYLVHQITEVDAELMNEFSENAAQ